MTIKLNRKSLQSSIARVQGCCDDLGLRLGKGEDKAQQIACAVLNQPNWHVALSEASKNDEHGFQMPVVAAACGKLLNLPFVNLIDEKAFIKSTLNSIKELESAVEFIGSISGIVRTMDMTSSHLIDSATSGKGHLNEEETAVILLNYLFLEKLLTTLSHLAPKDTLSMAKSNLDRLALALKHANAPIPCPDCGTCDDENDGFTTPSDGVFFYTVCQCCGRRTLEDDWNNPATASLDLAEFDEYQDAVKGLEKLKAMIREGVSPTTLKRIDLDSITTPQALTMMLGDGTFKKELEANVPFYVELVREAWAYAAPLLDAKFIPAADDSMKLVQVAPSEMVLFEGQICMVDVEPRLGMLLIKSFLGEGKSSIDLAPDAKAIRLGKLIQ
ncbi:hypothetical protein [Vibrio owensii]|uniref:hypothetical protein n=1 Tax=Vibrio owensii TaxID=696485 RepID=UPI003CC6D3E4